MVKSPIPPLLLYENDIMNDLSGYIGQKVVKESGKPFKSGRKINTVKSVTNHPSLNIPAFTFQEDDSVVECRQVELVKD